MASYSLRNFPADQNVKRPIAVNERQSNQNGWKKTHLSVKNGDVQYYSNGRKYEKPSIDKHAHLNTYGFFFFQFSGISKIHKGINQMSSNSIKTSQIPLSLLSSKEH